MMILLYASLAYLSTPSSVGFIIILYSSCTETYNENFGINCFGELPSMDT